MRGRADQQLPHFHTFEVEDRIGANHPLRDIKRRTVYCAPKTGRKGEWK